MGIVTQGGRDPALFSPLPTPYADIDPYCYDPKARVAAMDLDGVLASLCYPNFPRARAVIILRGEGPGARTALRQGLQRFCLRRMGGRLRLADSFLRSSCPLWGPGRGRSRDRSLRSRRCERSLLLGEPIHHRVAVDPRRARLLGTDLQRGERGWDADRYPRGADSHGVAGR